MEFDLPTLKGPAQASTHVNSLQGIQRSQYPPSGALPFLLSRYMVPFSTGDQHSWILIPCYTPFVHNLMAARCSGWHRSWSREASPVRKAIQPMQQTVLSPGHFNVLSFSISTCPWVPAQDTRYSCQLFEPPLCKSSDVPAQSQKQATTLPNRCQQNTATLTAVPKAVQEELLGELLTSCMPFHCLHQDSLSKYLEINLQLNTL